MSAPEQRTSIRPTHKAGRWAVVYDGEVIGHVEKDWARVGNYGHAGQRPTYKVVGGAVGFRDRGDAVAHLVRNGRGPR